MAPPSTHKRKEAGKRFNLDHSAFTREHMDEVEALLRRIFRDKTQEIELRYPREMDRFICWVDECRDALRQILLGNSDRASFKLPGLIELDDAHPDRTKLYSALFLRACWDDGAKPRSGGYASLAQEAGISETQVRNILNKAEPARVRIPPGGIAIQSPQRDPVRPVDSKPLSMMPSLLNQPVFGRDDDLKELWEKLELDKSDAYEEAGRPAHRARGREDRDPD